MPERAGHVNAYACEECGHRTVTINAVDGTTPFLIRCKAPGCEAMARSELYRVDQHTRPGWEWYRPEGDELEGLDDGTREYVANGCLLLRKLDAAGLEEYGFRLRRG